MLYDGTRCLTEDEAIGVAQGIIEGAPLVSALDHIQHCDSCRNLVDVNRPSVVEERDFSQQDPFFGEIDEIFENISTLLEADDRLQAWYRRKV